MPLADTKTILSLIGAVSVSNQYSPASRELIARYFEKQMGVGE
jgi:hypothetical protein